MSATADTDLANGTATVTYTASGGGYNNTPSASLTAREVDNTGQVVVQDASNNAITSIDVPENGNVTYKVKLSHQPTGGTVSVRLTYASGGDSSITRSPSNLYFNRTTWNTAQTVTLRAANDSDTTAGTRSIVHTASGGGYNSAYSQTLAATEVEDDYAVVLRNAADNAVITGISVPEGSTATYKVKLSVQPSGNVSVAIAAKSGGDNDITFSPASLSFTTQNWSTAQTVTLTAAEDNGDIIDGTATITHTASGGSYGNTSPASLTATESDNDTGTVMVRNAADNADITTIEVPENGNIAYKVKLSHQPSGNVAVRLTYQSGGDSDITASPINLFFNATNWSTAKTVTLRARDDNDQAVGTRTIVHTSTGGGYSDTANLTASEGENDHAIILSPATGVSVAEGGTGSYTVRLSVLPTADVTVTIAEATTGNATDSDITVTNPSIKQLTFSTTTWSAPQTVTLSAAEDNNDLTNGSRVINHSASGGGYANVTASLTATEADNDNDGAIVLRNLDDDADITNLGVQEGGTARYKVKLDKEPRGTVTVALTYESGGDTDLTVGLPTSRTLTFNATNWSTGQTVTLRAAEDNGMAFGSRTIEHTASGTDSGYSAADAADLTAIELDNDVVIELMDDSDNDTDAMNVKEGGTATYKVKLSSRPPQGMGNVTVTLTASGDSDITFDTDDQTTGDQNTLTFTRDDYGTGKVVTVSAAPDSDTSNGSKTITHRASGGGYDQAAASTLAIREEDGPTLSLTASATTVTTTIAQHTNAWWYKVTGNVACNSVAQGTTEVSLSSLAWNTEYTITGYSDSSCATVLAPAAKVTTLNPALASSNVGATAATLTLSNWDMTKDGSWYYKANTGPHTSCSSAQTSLSTNVTGLSNATAYTYTAYNGSACSGTGIATASAFTTLAQTQGGNQIQQLIQQPEADPPGSVTGLTASRSGGEVTASWNASDGATGYDVVYSTDGKVSWTRAATNQSSTSYTLTGADDGKAYVFAVRAVNDAGASGWTNSAEVAAVTPPPGGVASVTVDHNGGSVAVTWTAADHATGYDVVYSTDGGYSWTRVATNQPGASYTLSDADSGTTYKFSVRAVNESGASGWTNSDNASHSGG